MANSLSAVLQRVCDESWGELLPAAGFAVTPARDRLPLAAVEYRRHAGTCIQKIDVQRDKYWTNKKGRFCVNLEVLFPKTGNASAANAMDAGPGGDCFGLAARLGMLATGSDHWWELKRGLLVGEDRMIQQVAADLRQKWVEFGVPWFERLTDLRAARDEAACGWALGNAISMSLALGELAEARELLIDSLCLGNRPTPETLARDNGRGLISDAEVVTLQRLAMQNEPTLKRGLETLFGRSHPRVTPNGNF